MTVTIVTGAGQPFATGTAAGARGMFASLQTLTPDELITLTTAERPPSPRSYLMCPPSHFAVTYAINPWMRPDQPADADRAMRQWERLRQIYLDLGHTVQIVDPIPGLPDMVFAANGATVVAGTVLGVKFRHPERAAEADAYLDWFRAAGHPRVHTPRLVNEGEGDILFTGRALIAGHGFRSDPATPAELEATFGMPAIGVRLVDPRYYHLDTALCVLDADTAAYYPPRANRGIGRGRRGAWPERGQRRPPRGPARAGHRPRGPARGARLRADRRGPVRAAQGRRRAEVLHARAPQLTGRRPDADQALTRRPFISSNAHAAQGGGI